MTRAPQATEPTRIIILGALSAVAKAAAREWSSRGRAKLMLVGRDANRLEAVAGDLRLRGAEAETFVADLSTADTEATLAKMVARLGGIDIVLVAYGMLGNQSIAERSPADAHKILVTNFLSAASWCLAAANAIASQNRGSLLVIGSVAGDRGRASNYIYGAAKGGLGILVEGIAHRLAHSDARAVLIKLGFVDTPMTAHVEQKGILWSNPESIAKLIVKIAEIKTHNRPVVYVPSYWRWIMLVIRNVPPRLFHKTRF
jgi:decaprenylphospho-beta-D-erythro-pentofuranosid-2-ulose 2-reductase